MQSSNTIYIKIYENRVIVRNIDDLKEISLSSDSPFSSTRLLIGSFTVARALITRGIKIVMGKKFHAPSILMHPREKIDGGLSQVEERVLKDLAISVGAQKVVLWTGQELTDADALNKVTASE